MKRSTSSFRSKLNKTLNNSILGVKNVKNQKCKIKTHIVERCLIMVINNCDHNINKCTTIYYLIAVLDSNLAHLPGLVI